MNQPDPTATVTMLEQFVELRVTGRPDVKNKYGSGHIRPSEVSFRYRAGGVRAQVYGRWVRAGGELTDAPCSQDYAAHEGDMTDWPEWLAADAKVHAPAPVLVSPPPDRAAADGDDTLRWLRRESLLVLLTRLQRGRTLTEDDAGMLRQHVETEMCEANVARADAQRLGLMVSEYGEGASQLGDKLREARAVLAEANEVMDLQKEFLGKLRQGVLSAMGHREDEDRADEGQDPCAVCGKDHMVQLLHAIEDADAAWAARFPATPDGPARPGRLPAQ
ncbi:hypothetical protein AB0H51_11535 [Streptomyces griseoluteus]|uniref:hypothetical protein n=1 Tax=Streptomyces griseoluteus TaxID=29306 RepID=UPI0034040EFF